SPWDRASMLTIEDLIQQALPTGALPVACHDQLGVEVTWAVALRSRAPGFDGLRGGELAIVSLATLRQLDDRLTLARLIDQIAPLGVAAVAVIGTIDDDAVRAAERARLPLIRLPGEPSARELEAQVTRAIVDRRAELQRLGQTYYHQLLELVIAGRGAEAVVARLAEITGRPAALQDAALTPIAVRLPSSTSLTQAEVLAVLAHRRPDDLARLQALPINAADPPTIRLGALGEPLARIVAPVGGPLGREGYLSVIGPAADLAAVDRLAVSRAAAACAMDLARERAARTDVDLRLAEVLDDLLAGSYPSEASLIGRAQRLGVDLTQPQLAIALRLVGADGLPAPRNLERALRRELNRRSLPPAARLDPQGAVALLPPMAPEAVRALIAVVREGAAGVGGHLAAAFARPACGVQPLRDALQTALRALDVAVRRDGPDAVVSVAEMGVDELLLALGPSPLLATFRDEWLGRLMDYDAKNQTRLVDTLAAYFNAHGSPTEAAERLHLHRNTLLYRIQRIREITGRDPDDPPARLAFHLALRIAAILGPITDR
ncbi:MAG: helix-turn-helix domain-containing protein, partial [Dehalococcoidia bacterium]|nr:helix-turn-helix domain-containing protein [Dehalococcoidia bacterium]